MNKTHSYIVFLLFCLSMLVSTVSTADRSYGPVKNKDFLSKIVNKSYPNSSLTRDQLMIGILRANYDSFRGGNVHFLKVGETLTLPDEDVIGLIDREEAAKTVKEHLVYFKRGRPGSFPAVPLPKVATPEPTETTVDEKVEASKENIEGDVATDKQTDKSQLVPVEGSVIDAEKETETNRTKLESLETEKNEQDEVLQSLEMQIKKLEEELKSTASEKKTAEVNVTFSGEKMEAKKPELSGVDSDKESLEESTISVLENNLSSKATDEGAAVKDVPREEAVTSTKKGGEIEALKDTGVEEKALVEEQKQEKPKIVSPESVSKEVAATEEVEAPATGFSIPWWVWLIPLVLLPLIILGIMFKSKERVSSTDLEYIKKPKKKAEVVELPHVNASEPVVKTSTSPTIAEADNAEIDVETPKVAPANTAHAAGSASEKEVSLKIDMARAYLDMDYHDAAVEILNEVVAEGNAVQVERAREILERV